MLRRASGSGCSVGGRKRGSPEAQADSVGRSVVALAGGVTATKHMVLHDDLSTRYYQVPTRLAVGPGTYIATRMLYEDCVLVSLGNAMKAKQSKAKIK